MEVRLREYVERWKWIGRKDEESGRFDANTKKTDATGEMKMASSPSSQPTYTISGIAGMIAG